MTWRIEAPRMVQMERRLAQTIRGRGAVAEAVIRESGRSRRRLERTARRNAATFLSRRSGGLVNSLRAVVERGRGNRAPSIVIQVRGEGARYAAIQEYGTRPREGDSPFPTIRPRRAKALAHPVGRKVLTGRGSHRYRSPRNYPGRLRFIRFRSSSGVVIGGLYDERDLERHRRRKRPGLPDPQYLLRTETQLRGRRFARRAMEEELPRFTADMSKAMRAVIFGRAPAGAGV